MTVSRTILACVGLLLLTPAVAAAESRTIQDCADCPQMVVIPAGQFAMGSPTTEKYRGMEALHAVTIALPFAVGRYEVTFAQWDACVAAGGCRGYRPADEGWGRGRQPVTNVGWSDGKAYVAWLSQTTGKPYRLLSETEWEYAARGGTATPFGLGATISTAQANFDASEKTDLSPKGLHRGRAVPVGRFRANAFGLHDMHGNVWEWVEDCWNDDYAAHTPNDGKPALAGECGGRVLRGGSWEDYAGDIRSSARTGGGQDEPSNSDGLRVARDLEPSEIAALKR
jgi:formylglycine-generating enzyme required for sulfatase activity